MRFLLGFPVFYELLQHVLRGHGMYEDYVRRYIKPVPGSRILDLGCGPGVIVPYLHDVEYVGLDASRQYIEAATQKYGDKGTFICQTVTEHTVMSPGSFDRVLATGLLHHLDDEEACALLRLAKQYLKPDGKLVTLDGCFAPEQSLLAHALLRLDRGRHVRTEAGYTALARKVFDDVRVDIRHDLFRMPYTCAVLEYVPGPLGRS